MLRNFSVVLTFVLLLSVRALAVTPHLVKDIAPATFPGSSSPKQFEIAGGLIYFNADLDDAGRELWRTDGTAAGTFQVADVCPGECSSDPGFVASGGSLFFFQVSGLASPAALTELWATAGLPANTFRLNAALRFVRTEHWSLWLASQRVLYFFADDGIHGLELWRSDGTPVGTSLVADIRPGPEGSRPDELAALNGKLFFRADDGVQGPALWTSDGTARGTRLAFDPDPRSANHQGPALIRSVGRNLLFSAPVPGRGDQLWKSDGSSRGTTPLTSFRSAPSTAVRDAAVLGSRLLFIGFDPVKGQELWVSDGTAKGTRSLTSFTSAQPFFNSRLPRVALGSRLIFRADDGVHGLEPWITDGTPKGTKLLQDTCPGPCWGSSSASDPLFVSGGLLFFSASDGMHGAELWATDGTAARTRMVQDLCPGSCDSSPSVFSAGAGRVFVLTHPNGSQGTSPQLWRSDGTAPGTVLLRDFGVDLFQGSVLNGALLFGARDDQHGAELWRSDGTAETTRLLADLETTASGLGSDPMNLRAAGGKLFFLADDGQHGRALWVSDGTAAGTRLAYEFEPNPFFAPTLGKTVEAGGLLFYLTNPDVEHPLASPSLWRTDGTSAGTFRLDTNALRIDESVGLHVVGNQVYFGASDGEHGGELWTTDGTPGGTRLVADLNPGSSSSGAFFLTPFQRQLYFRINNGRNQEIWRTDGTAGGTALVKGFDAGPDSFTFLSFLTVHAGRLYFFVNTLAGFDEVNALWSTDGTTAGTAEAAGVLPEPDSFDARFMISTGSRLFFSGQGDESQGLWVSDGTAAGTAHVSNASITSQFRRIAFNGDLYFADTFGGALWKSDGTAAGTGRLLDGEGNEIRNVRTLQVFAGRLYFTSGGWLYQSDGTPAGTSKLLEVEPESELVSTPAHLFFRRFDSATGTELWALDP